MNERAPKPQDPAYVKFRESLIRWKSRLVDSLREITKEAP